MQRDLTEEVGALLAEVICGRLDCDAERGAISIEILVAAHASQRRMHRSRKEIARSRFRSRPSTIRFGFRSRDETRHRRIRQRGSEASRGVSCAPCGGVASFNRIEADRVRGNAARIERTYGEHVRHERFLQEGVLDRIGAVVAAGRWA